MDEIKFVKNTTDVPKDDEMMTTKRSGSAVRATLVTDKGNNRNHTRMSKSSYATRDINGNVVTRSYNIADCRNVKNVKRALRDVELILLGNFNGGDSEAYATLTYSSKMTDAKQLNKDFNLFYKRLNYHFSQYNLAYLRINEPQSSGSLHIHLLLKEMDGKKLDIKEDDLAKLWGKGSVRISRIYYVRGLADYLCCLYTQCKMTDEIKMDRVMLYPKHMKVYSKSKNLKLLKGKEAYSKIKQEANKYNGRIDCLDIMLNSHKLNTVTIAEYREKSSKGV